jgi:biopolymer transport protein TolQ
VGTELSIWALFANASMLVKGVMILLLMASVVSWSFIIQRSMVLRKARGALAEFENRFWSGADLSKLYEQLTTKREELNGITHIFQTGFKEFIRLRKQTGIDPAAVMQGTERAMRVAYAREADQLETHLTFFATVGSMSPYIGLFGTVWGIMHSFIALGAVQQATLPMVAPGIAEALVATAMGLVAAIPAGIAYNYYSQSVDDLRNQYATFQEEFTSILHRQAHSSN